VQDWAQREVPSESGLIPIIKKKSEHRWTKEGIESRANLKSRKLPKGEERGEEKKRKK